jgi:peptidoglycan/LPS O-acetylase OafA/YrhL
MCRHPSASYWRTLSLNASARSRPPHTDTPRKKSHRRDIQGLRAVAVLAVLLDHLFGWPRGGFVGVDIFFVISGFLITGLLLREHERTGTISFRSFYERRVKRILPASVLVLFVTAVAGSLLFPVTRALSTLGDALWSMVFMANWRFALTGTDYFQEGTLPSPLQHYWSLGVEEQFYLVWPWLMLAVLALVVRTRGAGANPRIPLAVVVLLIMATSFVWALVETVTNPTVAYFSTATRAWELGLGALLAIVSPAFSRIPQRLRSPLAWAGLLGMVASILWVTADQGGFPAPLAALPVLSAGLVIIAGTGGGTVGPWPLTNRISGYVGDISFSLYLWHWPVIILLLAVMPGDSWPHYLLALVLSFALSMLSYHCVENPLRKATWFRRRSARERSGTGRLRSVLVAATAAVAVVAVSAAAVSVTQGVSEQGKAGAAVGPGAAEAGSQPQDELMARCLGAAAVAAGDACDGRLGDQVWPSLETFAEDITGQFQCWRSKGGEAFPDCTLGDPDGEFRVALMGDSHAASYLPAVEAIADRHGWTLDVFTGYSCHWYAQEEDANCYGPLQEANGTLLTGEPYDAVLVTSSRYDKGYPLQERIERYVRSWEPVAERGTRIIAITDPPATSEEAVQCLTRIGFSVADHECGLPRQEALAMVDPLPEVASRVEGAGVVDLTEYFCTADFCPAVIGNAVVYRDANGHLSATYARSLTPFLEEDLLELLDR